MAKNPELTDEQVDNNYNDTQWSTNGTKAVYAGVAYANRKQYPHYIASYIGNIGVRNVEAKANARRAAVCVNACNGIPTEVLESNRKWMDSFHWAINILEANMEDWNEETQDRIKKISKLLEPINKE